MPEKIHCDLLEVPGPDWVNITSEQVECLVNTIHTAEELYGEEPQLYGFVGTQQVGNIIGGYFAIQYEEDEFHYNKQKQLRVQRNSPFARIFFVLFASTGKLLLQNTKFVGIPLSMPMALRLFRNALDQALAKCKIRKTIDFYLASETTGDQDFIKEFERSTRVVKLEVTNPSPDKIPEGFEYYNPLRDRNSIIRDSHKHDYSHLRRIELEARADGNLKETHLRDLLDAAKVGSMTYIVELEEFVLRREIPSKFEFYLDMKAERLSKEELLEVINRLRRERALFLETPSPSTDQPRQRSLFDFLGEEEQ